MLTLQTVYPYGLNDRVGDGYMASYHCIIYTNVQSIITLNKILLKSLPHILIKILLKS